MEENDKISEAMLETVEKAYGMLFDADALQESILGHAMPRLAKSIVAAAIALGCYTGNAFAGSGQAASVKADSARHSVPGGTSRISMADIKNVYASKSYNERVSELIKKYTAENPARDEQRILDAACQQALAEVMSGKLKL